MNDDDRTPEQRAADEAINTYEALVGTAQVYGLDGLRQAIEQLPENEVQAALHAGAGLEATRRAREDSAPMN
jgi:hypothetical protein